MSDSVQRHRQQPIRLHHPWNSPGKNTRVGCHFLLQFRKVKSESESRSVLSNSLQPHRLYSPWNSPGLNTGVGSHSLLQRIFPTQESNPGLLHCRQVLHQLSHQESPRIMQWVAISFSRGSSQPRDQTRVFCIGRHTASSLLSEPQGKSLTIKTPFKI